MSNLMASIQMHHSTLLLLGLFFASPAAAQLYCQYIAITAPAFASLRRDTGMAFPRQAALHDTRALPIKQRRRYSAAIPRQRRRISAAELRSRRLSEMLPFAADFHADIARLARHELSPTRAEQQELPDITRRLGHKIGWRPAEHRCGGLI